MDRPTETAETAFRHGLDRIALADVDAREAFAILRPILPDLDEPAAQRIYAALRAWTWKALNDGRRDADIRTWFNVLRTVQATFARHGLPQAERVRVLYELIHESVSVEETIPAAEILKRTHVRQIVRMIRTAPNGILDRGVILEALSIPQDNLTRLMRLLLSTRLADQKIDGGRVTYSLTVEGLEAADAIIAGVPSSAARV